MSDGRTAKDLADFATLLDPESPPAVNLLADYRIPDSKLFHAILNEGEFLAPVEVDRNVEHKRPRYSADVIADYHPDWLGAL